MDERVPILSQSNPEAQSSHLPFENDRISPCSSDDDDDEEENLHSSTPRIKELLPKLFYGFFGVLLCGTLSQSCLLLKTFQEYNVPMSVLSSVSLIFYVLLCLMLIYVASGKPLSFMEFPRTYLILSIVNWILLILIILNIVMFIFMV